MPARRNWVELLTAQAREDNATNLTIDETPIGWSHKKWALNSGIQLSQGEIILQTDADCIPKSGWVQSMVSKFSDPSVVFVSGPAPLTCTFPERILVATFCALSWLPDTYPDRPYSVSFAIAIASSSSL